MDIARVNPRRGIDSGVGVGEAQIRERVLHIAGDGDDALYSGRRGTGDNLADLPCKALRGQVGVRVC